MIELLFVLIIIAVSVFFGFLGLLWELFIFLLCLAIELLYGIGVILLYIVASPYVIYENRKKILKCIKNFFELKEEESVDKK